MSKYPPRITDTPLKWFLAIVIVVGLWLTGKSLNEIRND